MSHRELLLQKFAKIGVQGEAPFAIPPLKSLEWHRARVRKIRDDSMPSGKSEDENNTAIVLLEVY